MKVDVSQMPVPVSLALAVTAGAGLLFVILRFLFMPDGLSRAWGLYLAIIAAAVLRLRRLAEAAGRRLVTRSGGGRPSGPPVSHARAASTSAWSGRA